VKSRILWVQMLGRGTLLCPEIHKTHFTIFDCFNGTLIEYFRNATDFNVEPPRREPLPIERVIENIYQNVDRDYHVRVLVKRLRRIEKDMSGEAREKFAASSTTATSASSPPGWRFGSRAISSRP